MKQLLTFRLVVLALSVVISTVLLESVAELERPLHDGDVQVAEAVQAQVAPPLR